MVVGIGAERLKHSLPQRYRRAGFLSANRSRARSINVQDILGFPALYEIPAHFHSSNMQLFISLCQTMTAPSTSAQIGSLRLGSEKLRELNLGLENMTRTEIQTERCVPFNEWMYEPGRQNARRDDLSCVAPGKPQHSRNPEVNPDESSVLRR